jgi:hypothetical protein
MLPPHVGLPGSIQSRLPSNQWTEEFRFTAQRNNFQNAVRVGKLPTPNQLGVGITPDELAEGPAFSMF